MVSVSGVCSDPISVWVQSFSLLPEQIGMLNYLGVRICFIILVVVIIVVVIIIIIAVDNKKTLI